jgi:hypothetical protein
VILTAVMAHQRKLIRHAVVATLKNVTAAGERVQATRIEPQKGRDLPSISVYTLHDPVDEGTVDTAPRELKHDLQLEIAGVVAHRDSYTADDAMDDLAEQIEDAMDGNRYLLDTSGSHQAAETVLLDTVMQVVGSDGKTDPEVGIVTLTYGVTYRKSPASQAGSDDLLRVDAKETLVGGVADTAQPEDLINVRSP